MKKRRAAAVIRAWGGFVDGKLAVGWRLGERPDITPLYSVFRTRAAARRVHGDVRRIEIHEVKRATSSAKGR